MLSRAVKSFEPPVPRRDRAAVAAPSSSPKSSLDGFLQSPRPASQKTLGGYTGLINKRAVGGYARPNLPSGPISTRPPASSGYNRTSSDMSGLAATLNKPDAFKEPACVVDLTQETTAPVVSSHITNVQFEFNPDDFDDDSDIDLDFEYPQSLPTLDTKREPLTTVPVNTVPSATLAVSEEDVSNKLQYPTSTWSSSPVSHKMAPPAALRRQQCDNPLVPMAPPSSVDPEPPRPAKRRRMLPWMPQQAIEPSPAETSESSRPTSREDSHQGASVQTPPRVSKTHAFLDATESVMKAQQKAFKDQQRKVKKGSALPAGEMQDVKRTTNQDLYRPICLTDEQRKVENLVVNEKKSVFFTGSAGTGKSVLMRSIIASLRKVYARETDRVAVTASTGLAACNIGGVTLHSFAGIGLGKGTVEELAKKVNTNQKARTRWIRTKILIVDEVSMLDGDLFDKLEAVAKKVRKNGRPFGGIQLVITGDFFQLPPVPDGGNRAVKFCFDAATWPTVIHHTILLTEVFRQRDPVFARMLNEMRLGNITDETVKAFRRLERPISQQDALTATELFPTRHEVDNANAFRMRNLAGKIYEFKAEDTGSIKDLAQRERILSNCMAPPLLTLKKGAQVMLIKNMDEQLVNGSVGLVAGFMTEPQFALYQENEALFYDESPDSSTLNITSQAVNDKLRAYGMGDAVADTGKLWPVVDFKLPDDSKRRLHVHPEVWKTELPNGEIQAQRKQVPLILAWSLSIHKAQGQTLPRVKVDLRKVFEKGQAYVALSRATCQEGLQVLNFDKRKVMAHRRVAEFYNSLYSVDSAAIQRSKMMSAYEFGRKGVTGVKEEVTRVKEEVKRVKEEVTRSRSTTHSFDSDEEEALAAMYG